MLSGAITLREINKRLGVSLPLDGTKTINGLLLKYLQENPETNVSIKLNGVVIEMIEANDNAINLIKLTKLRDKSTTAVV